MDWQDILSIVFACITLAVILGGLVYSFIKYGTKQMEIDYKCRKSQLKFYEMATLYLENQVNVEIENRRLK